MFSIIFTSEFSPTSILFLYWEKLFLVKLKNSISIGFSTTVFFSTIIVNPLFARAEFSSERTSLFLQLKSEKPEIINSINASGKLEEDSEKALTELIVELKKNFN